MCVNGDDDNVVNDDERDDRVPNTDVDAPVDTGDVPNALIDVGVPTLIIDDDNGANGGNAAEPIRPLCTGDRLNIDDEEEEVGDDDGRNDRTL
jgi:hypothetical protein